MPLRKKELFSKCFFFNFVKFLLPLSPLKALVAGPLKKNLFLRLPLSFCFGFGLLVIHNETIKISFLKYRKSAKCNEKKVSIYCPPPRRTWRWSESSNLIGLKEFRSKFRFLKVYSVWIYTVKTIYYLSFKSYGHTGNNKFNRCKRWLSCQVLQRS